MRTSLPRRAGLLAAGLTALTALSALGAPAAVAASPSAPPASPAPSASGSIAPLNAAGTTFLTASTLAPGQDADVPVSTGDYLYWAFAASEGQTDTVRVNVTLSDDRHGPQTWTVELFDGLRRRQSCTAGPQSATAEQSTTTVALSCTLRQVRSWAEPWSGDPLPGTYYVRLSVNDTVQQDLGLAAQVKVHVGAKGGADDAQPEGGSLKAPLVPPVNAGSTVAPTAALPSATPSASAGSAAPGTVHAAAPAEPESHWYSDLFSGWNTRWWWTAAGGALAALAGVAGYTLTRHPRGRRPAGPAAVPRQTQAPANPAPQYDQYR